MELKITKERVVEAAKSCPQADAVLKELFPEAFVDDLSDMHMKKFINLRDKSLSCFVLVGPRRILLFKYGFPAQNVDGFQIVTVDSNGSINGYMNRTCFLSAWKPAE